MHHSFLDRYSDLSSPVHRFDPRVKTAVAAVAVVCVATLPPGRPGAAVFFAASILFLWLLARLPIAFLARRIAMLAPFILLMSFSAAWTKYRAMDSGAVLFASYVVLRAAVAVAVLSLLASTTPFPRLLSALGWYRVPAIMLSLLAFTYRFIYVLVDELERLNVGRRSREFSKNLVVAWRGRAWMLGSFLVRSLERSERVYQAMLARGYAGKVVAAVPFESPRALELIFGAATIAALVAVRAGASV